MVANVAGKRLNAVYRIAEEMMKASEFGSDGHDYSARIVRSYGERIMKAISGEDEDV